MRQLFTVSSGRSGTFLIHRLLSLFPQVESHHEFCCTHVQKLGVLNYLGLIPKGSLTWGELHDIYRSGVFYSQAELWANASNKDSWVIPSLYKLFPEARFVWLVRDGRRVASSYYHKLPEEAYVDRWVKAMYQWLDKRPSEFEPSFIPVYWEWWDEALPPDKPYWWPIPRPTDPIATAFRHQFTRWQRLCWFWTEVNRVIGESLNQIPTTQWVQVRLEDLTRDRDVLRGLLNFAELDCPEEAYQLVGRPVNVNEPVNYSLTEEQKGQYWELCGEMHQRLGYRREEVYDVRY